jgi:hypothetical protein
MRVLRKEQYTKNSDLLDILILVTGCPYTTEALYNM